MARDDLGEFARNGAEAFSSLALRDIDDAGGDAAAGRAFRVWLRPGSMPRMRIIADYFGMPGKPPPKPGKPPPMPGSPEPPNMRIMRESPPFFMRFIMS